MTELISVKQKPFKSVKEAREATEEFVAKRDNLYADLLSLYYRGAHIRLGCPDSIEGFHAYAQEYLGLGMTEQTIRNKITAAEVSAVVDKPVPIVIARQLARLPDADAKRRIWGELQARETHGTRSANEMERDAKRIVDRELKPLPEKAEQLIHIEPSPHRHSLPMFNEPRPTPPVTSVQRPDGKFEFVEPRPEGDRRTIADIYVPSLETAPQDAQEPHREDLEANEGKRLSMPHCDPDISDALPLLQCFCKTYLAGGPYDELYHDVRKFLAEIGE